MTSTDPPKTAEETVLGDVLEAFRTSDNRSEQIAHLEAKGYPRAIAKHLTFGNPTGMGERAAPQANTWAPGESPDEVLADLHDLVRLVEKDTKGVHLAEIPIPPPPRFDHRLLAKSPNFGLDYVAMAKHSRMDYRPLKKLIWKGIPEQRPDGSWVEIWHARLPGGQRDLFTAELRECMGIVPGTPRPEPTAILRDHREAYHLPPGPRTLGHFRTLTGAQNRARRVHRGG